MKVHLVDGTYELFRHYFGQPSRIATDGTEVGATYGVVLSVVAMLATDATHVGVATDHVIESFRNELWPGYKSGAGVPPDLRAQFEFLESALAALGVVVWPMVELEADDALASAASVTQKSSKVDQVIICTPDKDLAQCVVGDRVVQLDRRKGTTTDEAAVWGKFGVAPRSIPDWLALVGDSADGFPGLAGWGRRTASSVLARYGTLDSIPNEASQWDPAVREEVRGATKLAQALARDRELAELFRVLATLRVDPSLLDGVNSLKWTGATDEFEDICKRMRAPTLAERVAAMAKS
ncbi:MAG: 5'-3' exonuclease H3TH domain-containing protein [Acidimicrobiales bacterium]